MAMAAGQSEALAPTMIEESHFLHERARKLAWYVVIETTVVAVFFCTSNFMVSAWGWRWWYGFFAVFNAIVLILSFLLVPETLFTRPDEATTGKVHLKSNGEEAIGEDEKSATIYRATIKQGIILDTERYGPRTWRQDLKLVVFKGSWTDVPKFVKEVILGFCHPLLLWILLLNGAFLGLYIFMAARFARILVAPPYAFAFTSLGYVQGAQIFVCMVSLPLLGYGNDALIKWMSNRNKGIYRPEYRLLTLAFLAITGVVSAIIFGQAAAFPAKYHWSAVAVTFNIIFFAFVGANIVGLIYAADSFPLKVGPLFVVICPGRAFISFGLSYAVIPSISSIGYNGIMNIEGALCAVLAALAIPVYFLGPALRRLGETRYGFGRSKNAMI